MEGGGDLRQRYTSVADADNGDVGIGVGDWLPELPAIFLYDQRRRAVGDGRFEVLMAVDGESGDGDEEVAGVELAGILADSGDGVDRVALNHLVRGGRKNFCDLGRIGRC